jgi:hypothetical protein
MCTLAGCFGHKSQTFLLTGAGAATFVLLSLNIGLDGIHPVRLCPFLSFLSFHSHHFYSVITAEICPKGTTDIDNGTRAAFFSTATTLTALSPIWVAILLKSVAGQFYTSKRDGDLAASAQAAAIQAAQEINTRALQATAQQSSSSSSSKMKPLLSDDSLASLPPSDADEEALSPKLSMASAPPKPILEVIKTAAGPLLLAFFTYFPSYICYPIYTAIVFSAPTENADKYKFIAYNIFYLVYGVLSLALSHT